MLRSTFLQGVHTPRGDPYGNFVTGVKKKLPPGMSLDKFVLLVERRKETKDFKFTKAFTANDALFVAARVKFTPLSQVYRKGVVYGLIAKRGANPNILNRENETPLEVAVKTKNFAVASVLFEYTTLHLCEALTKAVATGFQAAHFVVEKLSRTEHCDGLLDVALMQDDPLLIDELVTHGMLDLPTAISRGNVHAVQKLAQVDPLTNPSILVEAASRDDPNIEIVRALLDAGANTTGLADVRIYNPAVAALMLDYGLVEEQPARTLRKYDARVEAVKKARRTRTGWWRNSPRAPCASMTHAWRQSRKRAELALICRLCSPRKQFGSSGAGRRTGATPRTCGPWRRS